MANKDSFIHSEIWKDRENQHAGSGSLPAGNSLTLLAATTSY